MTPCTAPRCGAEARWSVADRQLCRRHMLDALLAGRIGQAHAVPLEAEALEVEPEPVARLTDAEREAVAAATANHQRLCDEYGPSEEDEEILAALRGLLERTK